VLIRLIVGNALAYFCLISGVLNIVWYVVYRRASNLASGMFAVFTGIFLLYVLHGLNR
jgi:hypothetical protein